MGEKNPYIALYLISIAREIESIMKIGKRLVEMDEKLREVAGKDYDEVVSKNISPYYKELVSVLRKMIGGSSNG